MKELLENLKRTMARAVGMHLVLGERHAQKRANSGRALRDGRVRYVQGAYLKPE